jgi:hypothetical protein
MKNHCWKWRHTIQHDPLETFALKGLWILVYREYSSPCPIYRSANSVRIEATNSLTNRGFGSLETVNNNGPYPTHMGISIE